MKNKIYLILFLTFFGELLIVLTLLSFSYATPHKITYINLFVSSFIFLAFMTQFLLPKQYLGKVSQKAFAGMGILGVSMFLYGLLAIGLMFSMNHFLLLSFKTQLLVHAGLLFLLGMGVFLSLTAVDKAGTVQDEYGYRQNKINAVRKVAALIAEKASSVDIKPEEKEKISKAIDSLRFISPSNTTESAELDDRLLGEFQQLDRTLSLPGLDEQRLALLISNIESLCRQRKQQYSF